MTHDRLSVPSFLFVMDTIRDVKVSVHARKSHFRLDLVRLLLFLPIEIYVSIVWI